MRERITANLPARSFEEAASFYEALGFTVGLKTADWMIMERGQLEVEFFLHPGVELRASWFSACVRVADLDRLHSEWKEAGLPVDGIPRMTPPETGTGAMRMFAVVDPNGSLLRCVGYLGERAKKGADRPLSRARACGPGRCG